jgi:type I site-specific restriction-modification system R (restriction) subunit
MADDPNDLSKLDITDADAEKLLAEPDADAKKPEPSETDDKDWKAEAEKWKSLSRQNENSAKQTAAKLKQYEDANKTEAERLQEAATSNLSRAEKAEAALRRREIAESRAPDHATAKHIAQVAKRLAGESDDDLEKDADELFELLAPTPKDEPLASSKTPSRPQERLRGGAEPDDEPGPTDPRALANLIPRRS